MFLGLLSVAYVAKVVAAEKVEVEGFKHKHKMCIIKGGDGEWWNELILGGIGIKIQCQNSEKNNSTCRKEEEREKGIEIP